MSSNLFEDIKLFADLLHTANIILFLVLVSSTIGLIISSIPSSATSCDTASILKFFKDMAREFLQESSFIASPKDLPLAVLISLSLSITRIEYE